VSVVISRNQSLVNFKWLGTNILIFLKIHPKGFRTFWKQTPQLWVTRCATGSDRGGVEVVLKVAKETALPQLNKILIFTRVSPAVKK
jgi:hypothetical protein